MIIAPINVEYLARGPKVSIASDSNSPGVKENNACDASSGRNRPSPNSFIRRDIAMEATPETIPARNKYAT